MSAMLRINMAGLHSPGRKNRILLGGQSVRVKDERGIAERQVTSDRNR